MNRLFPLALAALCLAAPASAQITSFQHIILVIQENRTPDNLFQGLCPTHKPERVQHPAIGPDSTTSRQRGGWTRPRPPARPIQRPSSSASATIFRTTTPPSSAMCDLNASGACAMDGAAHVACMHALSHARRKRRSGMLIIPRARCSRISISSRPMVGETICSRPTRGPATRRINSCLARHRLRRRMTTTTAFSQRRTPHDRLPDVLPPTTTTVSLINPQGVEFTQIFPCFEHQTLADLLDAAGVSWRYYGSSGTAAIGIRPPAASGWRRIRSSTSVSRSVRNARARSGPRTSSSTHQPFCPTFPRTAICAASPG